MDLSALEKDAKGAARRPRGQKVKDKTAAPIQITAEQLLAEAAARQEAEIRPPRQRIMDGAELEEFRFRERKKFEDGLRRQRFNPANWTKYAAFEESQQEWDRYALTRSDVLCIFQSILTGSVGALMSQHILSSLH